MTETTVVPGPPTNPISQISQDIGDLFKEMRKPDNSHVVRCLFGALIPLQGLPYLIILNWWPQYLSALVGISMFFMTVGLFFFCLCYGIHLFSKKFCLTGGIFVATGFGTIVFMFHAVQIVYEHLNLIGY